MITASWPYAYGQQFCLSGAQPIAGNSNTSLLKSVTAAKYGTVQLPVNRGLPLNGAVEIGPVSDAGSATALSVIVEIRGLTVVAEVTSVVPVFVGAATDDV